MTRGTTLLLAIAAAAIASGAIILFMTPEGKSNTAEFQSWWIGAKEIPPAITISRSFALLNVIDGTRHFFNVDEQKVLFAGLSGILRDPLSAQVRNLRRTTDSKFGLCGEVNSKNGFGGYVGFQTFYGVLTGPAARIYLVPEDVVEKFPEESKLLLAKFGCPN